MDVVRAVVVGHGNAVTVFVAVARIAKPVVVKVGLRWIGDVRAVVRLVNEPVLVVVLVRASVLFNVVLFVRDPSNGSFWTCIVLVEDAVFIVVKVFGDVSASVPVVI